VNCIVYHNGAAGGDGIYIGTDIGVYYRDNSTNGWIDFSQGLPNCEVSDLEIYYATGRLEHQHPILGHSVEEPQLQVLLKIPV
jgi:hypothetical protein